MLKDIRIIYKDILTLGDWNVIDAGSGIYKTYILNSVKLVATQLLLWMPFFFTLIFLLRFFLL